MSKPSSICLFIGTLGSGGAERVMAWLANMLARHGYQVTLVTLSDPSTDIHKLDKKIKRTSLYALKRNHFIFKPWANLQRILLLRRIIIGHGCETIIAFMPHESIISILASFNTPARTIVSERNAPWLRSAGRPWNLLRKILYRFADTQVAQTKPVADWFRSTARCTNTVIIPNAVLPDLHTRSDTIKPQQQHFAERPFVLAVGTKVHQKGFDNLLEAFSKVSAAQPSWDLVIVGLVPGRVDGGLSILDVQCLVERYSLSDRVFLYGAVGNIQEWYEKAEIFALSSRFEGFPNVLLEAMARACACVSFDCETGPREIIRDGVDGFLVPDQDIPEFSSKLQQLMDDRDLRKTLQRNSVRSVTRFSEKLIFSKWREIIDKNQIGNKIDTTL